MYVPNGPQIIFMLELPGDLKKVRMSVHVSHALGLQFNSPEMCLGLCSF